jgi:hypothetical protein
VAQQRPPVAHMPTQRRDVGQRVLRDAPAGDRRTARRLGIRHLQRPHRHLSPKSRQRQCRGAGKFLG